MRVVIAGGGTGGHLYPGLAVAEEVLSRNAENSVLFAGASGGMEERLIPQLGYRLELLPSLKGGLFGLDFASKGLRFAQGYLQARRLLASFEADAVVGLGGYASALPVLAAWGIEVPSLILEQNLIPGRTTRKLSKFANAVGVQFPGCATKLSSRTRICHVGNPLRRSLIEVSRAAAERNLQEREVSEEPTLLVLGGSNGAQFLNDTVATIWPRLKKILPNLRVHLISGREDYDRALRKFAEADVRGKIYPFHDRIETLYEQADVVLARAGATTMAELAVFALPSILIPYPHAADDHQTANAQAFCNAGAAWMLPQKNIELERLSRRIADVLLQPKRRQRMANAAYKWAKPNAAQDVVDEMERMIAAKLQKRKRAS